MKKSSVSGHMKGDGGKPKGKTSSPAPGAMKSGARGKPTKGKKSMGSKMC